MDLTAKRAHIDSRIGGLLEEVRELPEVKETIGSWEAHERGVYLDERSLLVDQIFVLGHSVEAVGTEEQRAQYAALFRLYTAYRPIIDDLNSL